MEAMDTYGRRWPVRRVTLALGRFNVVLECVETFDEVLASFVESHPDNTDMIPYFADLWPSARALARHLQQRFESLTGLHVLELGCGLGVPSLIAGMLGGRVVAADFHPDNLPYIRANAALNQLENVVPVVMDWRDPKTDQTFDLILGSDLLYEQRQAGPLTACIKKLLATGGTLLLADPMREALQRAHDQLASYGLKPQLNIVDDIAIIEAHQ